MAILGADADSGGGLMTGPCEAMHGFEGLEGSYGRVDRAGVRMVIAGEWPKAVACADS